MATVFPNAVGRPLGIDADRERTMTGGDDVETHFTDPRSDRTWDALVLRHPEHTFFHSAAWSRVLCSSYGHTPCYLQLRQGEALLALLPLLEVDSHFTGRRAVCLPFSDHCGPLAFAQSTWPLLQERLLKLARVRRWKYIEVRGAEQVKDAHRCQPTFYVHKLDLHAGPDYLFSKFDSSVRRAVRKAERSGLTVQISNTHRAVEKFFDLHVRTRRRHGAPPQSRNFFRSIHEAVLEPGNGFVVQASFNERPIAGAMFFHFGQSAIFKFGASDENFHEHRGNNLVMWKGIEELIHRGARRLHFGRTSCDNQGLRRYKRAWGAREEPISYLRLDVSAGTWASINGHASALHERFFCRMPLTVNRLAGSLLYPHLH